MTEGRESSPRIDDTTCEPTGSRAPARPGRQRGSQTRRVQTQTASSRATASEVSRPDTHKNHSQLKKGAERQRGQVPNCSPRGECGKPCDWTAKWSQRPPLKAPTPQGGQAWTSQPVEQGPWAAVNSPRRSPVPRRQDGQHHHDHCHDHHEIQGIEPETTAGSDPRYVE